MERRGPGKVLAAGYAIGGLVDGIVFNAVNLFLVFYLTEVLLLSPTMAGLVIAIGLVADALASPWIGIGSDRVTGRFGRRLPFLVTAVLPLLLVFVALYALPALGTGPAALIPAAVLSILLRVLLAAYQLTHLALGSEIAADYNGRWHILAWRWTCNVTGGLIAASVGLGWYLVDRGLRDPGQYLSFAVTLASGAVVAAIISASSAYRTLAWQPPSPPPVERNPAHRELRELLGSGSFRRLFAGALLMFFGHAISSALNLHAKAYFWDLPAYGIRNVTIATFIGLICAGPVSHALLHRFEKRSVAAGGVVLVCLSQFLPVLLTLTGHLALPGPWLSTGLAVFFALSGLAIGATGIAWQAMVGDAADEHAQRHGFRREGLYFAGISVANKLAMAGGAFVAGLWLDWAGFRRVGGALANLPPIGAEPELVGIAFGFGSSLFWVMALIPLSGYRIDRQRHFAIRKSLAGRQNP